MEASRLALVVISSMVLAAAQEPSQLESLKDGTADVRIMEVERCGGVHRFRFSRHQTLQGIRSLSAQ
jgi:hypothetical protein